MADSPCPVARSAQILPEVVKDVKEHGKVISMDIGPRGMFIPACELSVTCNFKMGEA
jgi:hypothetical protein